MIRRLLAFLLFASLAWADGFQSTTFTTIGTGGVLSEIGSGIAFHKLTWTVSGTVSSCTVVVDSSTDGVSFNNGDVVSSQTCTTNGNVTSASFVANYTRVRVVTFVGTGSVTVAYNLYVNNPGGGGGGTWGSITGTLSAQTDLNTALGLKASTNPTTGTIPVKSGAATFGDSHIVDSANFTVDSSGNVHAASITLPHGSTADYVDLVQGTSNGLGTNSFRTQAAVSQTSVLATTPAAPPTNNFSVWEYSNASPSVGTFAKMPQTAITSGTAYTNATTTFSTVVGGSGQTLQFAVEASTNYAMTCQVFWQGSATTTGPKFQFTGPSSPTAVAAYAHSPVTTSTSLDASATAFSSSMADTGTITITTNFMSTITLGLVNGTTAGTVTLQAAANGAGTLTIQPGSFCVMQ